MMIKPKFIRLEAATACQLKCPICATALGHVDERIGTGFLKFKDFKYLSDKNPWIKKVELANYGEIFLNNDLLDIIKYAYDKGIILHAYSGTNMNNVREEVLEALAKYQFYFLSCSIDGASQEIYSIYRRGGNFDTVINNIKKINKYKDKYNSEYPKLVWQFVVFGHNEHEIDKAEKMAEDLNMKFKLKFSWDDHNEQSFAPVKNKEYIRKKSGLGVSSREEYEEKYKKPYNANRICAQLWRAPQINYDGRILGCCVNYWGDYGNAFKDGLLESLNNERMNYARDMLIGKKQEYKDIPCSNCTVYQLRKKNENWLTAKELDYQPIPKEYL